MKKSISLIISLIMLFSVTVPFFATAEEKEAESCSGSYYNIDWSYNSETKTLRFSDNGKTPPKSAPYIPEYYDSWYNPWMPSYPWYQSQYGYLYNAALSVEFDDSITEIIPAICFNFQALTSVKIPKTVKSIGKWAFYGSTNLADVTLPQGLEYIESSAFNQTAFWNAHAVLENDAYYFDNILMRANYNAEIITVRDGTTLIADGAFSDRHIQINLPKSVTQICDGAFPALGNLQSITVDKANPVFSDVNGVLFSKGKTELYLYPFARKDEIYYIPSTVKTVKTGFYKSYSLKKVVYPKSVTSIETLLDYNKTGYYMGTKDNLLKTLKSTAYLPSNMKYCKTKQSASVFTYDKKNHKPRVKVYAPGGEKLKKGTDYKISFPKKSKKINNYTVKIVLKGKYGGSYKLTYAVAPKGTSIKSISRDSTSAKVKWKKQPKYTTGFQVQYSQSETFLGKCKSVVVKGKNKTKATIKGLQENNYYYVRVRAYKKVKGKKVFSDWSKPKRFKTIVKL